MNTPPTPAPALPASSPLVPGTRFGAYEILQPLGAGGMGQVYRARDTRLGREVALKTIALDRQSHAEAIARFEREARSASALSHPNIVTIYELGSVEGVQYIAMELVAGQTLRELLESGPVPFKQAIAIAAQVGDALAKAHEAGIVHRDLKPENVMVAADWTVKVLDFGLAKLLAAETDAAATATVLAPVTAAGRVMGTLGYMSPEQASGGAVDFRSDQFSLGAVLYEMVAGQAAFPGRTHAEITAAVLRDAPERLASRTLPAPAPFVWIVERCLSKEPQQRYSSTRDLARDLAAVRDRLGEAPSRRAQPRISNLPAQRTAIIGREREAEALRALLERDEVQLVTLTGPGGIGKTRLALHVAGEVAEQFPAGVAFAALSAVSDARGIVPAISQALGVAETGNQPAQENLREFLRGLEQPLLLLLDNFEHLVTAAPEVAELLSLSPKLKIIATSQAPLHVYAEHEFPVPPLAVPDAKSAPSVEELAALPAVALFVERARAVKPQFALTVENAAAVAAICARLDGLPLAIELAAARIKLLSPAAMQARLEGSLSLLTGGARDLPARQQTLRGTVEWSYSLLNDSEQKLLRRLAVFAGGCGLDAVEAVCDTKGDLGLDVLDGMASVVDKSLVQQVEREGGDARFTMLSTIREYALERLRESGEEAATRKAHAAYCVVLAEEGAEDAATHPEWLDRFELEHDNFRAALEHLSAIAEVDWAMRLGTALFRFWETREHLSEGREWIARLLALPGAATRPKLRARLLFAGAVLAGGQGDYAAAQQQLAASLEICRELKDDRGIAVALNAMAVNARDRSDLETAAALFEQSLTIWREVEDPTAIARALSNLASVAKLQGDFARASALYDECLATFRQVGDAAGVSWTLNYQGDVARQSGDRGAARKFYEHSLAAFRQLRDGWGVASALSDLASLSADGGDYEEAHRLYAESLRTFQEVGHKRGVARVLECLASCAAAQANHAPALRLAGAAAALRQQLGTPLTPYEQSRQEQALQPARQELGSAAGMSAWMEGWALPLERAVKEALNYAQRGRLSSGY